MGYLIRTLDKKYLRADENNSVDPEGKLTNSKEEAVVFRSVFKADNFIKNCLPDRLKGKQLEIINEDESEGDLPIEVSEDPFITDLNLIIAQTINTKRDDLIVIEKLLQSLSKVVKGIVEEEQSLINQKAVVEKSIIDIYHYIELNDSIEDDTLNKLKDSLKVRREIKDRLRIIANLRNNIKPENIINIISDINSLENRVYKPRELDNLFIQED